MKGESIRILKHRSHIDVARAFANLGQSYEQAFGRPTDTLIDVAQGLRSAINWAWLQWHVKPQFRTISNELTFIALRSSDALAKGITHGDQRERGFHDWMMLCCAVLSGNRETMAEAAKQARGADARVKGHQHDRALAGVLAARIFGNEQDEAEQRMLWEKYKPMGINAFPSRALVRAFVRRDYRAVAKAVKEGAEKHWSDEYIGGGGRRWMIGPVIVEQKRGHMTLDLRRKDSYFLWPYVEAVFAKLALMDGASITYDDFWLPLDFVKAMVK
jgi:hypothetical protein